MDERGRMFNRFHSGTLYQFSQAGPYTTEGDGYPSPTTD